MVPVTVRLSAVTVLIVESFRFVLARPAKLYEVVEIRTSRSSYLESRGRLALDPPESDLELAERRWFRVRLERVQSGVRREHFERVDAQELEIAVQQEARRHEACASKEDR